MQKAHLGAQRQAAASALGLPALPLFAIGARSAASSGACGPFSCSCGRNRTQGSCAANEGGAWTACGHVQHLALLSVVQAPAIMRPPPPWGRAPPCSSIAPLHPRSSWRAPSPRAARPRSCWTRCALVLTPLGSVRDAGCTTSNAATQAALQCFAAARVRRAAGLGQDRRREADAPQEGAVRRGGQGARPSPRAWHGAASACSRPATDQRGISSISSSLTRCMCVCIAAAAAAADRAAGGRVPRVRQLERRPGAKHEVERGRHLGRADGAQARALRVQGPSSEERQSERAVWHMRTGRSSPGARGAHAAVVAAGGGLHAEQQERGVGGRAQPHPRGEPEGPARPPLLGLGRRETQRGRSEGCSELYGSDGSRGRLGWGRGAFSGAGVPLAAARSSNSGGGGCRAVGRTGPHTARAAAESASARILRGMLPPLWAARTGGGRMGGGTGGTRSCTARCGVVRATLLSSGAAGGWAAAGRHRRRHVDARWGRARGLEGAPAVGAQCAGAEHGARAGALFGRRCRTCLAP